MERIVIFSDHANMAAAFDQLGYPLDQADLIDYLTEGRFLVEAHTFVPIDPRDPSGCDTLIEALWKVGYLVHSKVGTIAGDGYRCNFDVDLTLEMMRTAEIVKPDIIVLLSGDKDFVPAILELRRRGIRVEIAAFPGHNAARDIMLKGSGFIDLERYRQQRWEAHEMLPEPPCADFKDNAVAPEEAPA